MTRRRYKKNFSWHARQSILAKGAPSDVYFSTLMRALKDGAVCIPVGGGCEAIYYKGFWWVVNMKCRVIITVRIKEFFEKEQCYLRYIDRQKTEKRVKKGKKADKVPFNNPFREFFGQQN